MGPLSSFLSFSLCTPAAAAYGKSSKGAKAERYMTVEKEPQAALACEKWPPGAEVAE